MEQTLIILKPEIIQRGLVGRILQRFEQRGLVIKKLAMEELQTHQVQTHYAHHADKPFFSGLVDFMTSGPTVLAILEGPGVIEMVRQMCGATNPLDAAPGTIRGDFSLEMPANAIHASDSLETAQREIELFFG